MREDDVFVEKNHLNDTPPSFLSKFYFTKPRPTTPILVLRLVGQLGGCPYSWFSGKEEALDRRRNSEL